MEPTVARPSLVRGGSLVAPALTLLNLVGYFLSVAAARAFDHEAYGRLNALLGVLLVTSVPALGVQSVVARSVARASEGERLGGRDRDLIRRATQIGLAAAAATALVAPLVAAFLHTDVAGPLWVAAQVAPLTVLSAALGVVQGHERFTMLAALIGLQALGKLVALVPLAAGGSVTDMLAALALGAALAAAIAVTCVGGLPLTVKGRGPSFGAREVAGAAGGLLALLLLANLDVLLARNVLSGGQSGRYAVGAVLAKAAFWLPQAVAVVVFPRLADPVAGKALLRRSALLVAGLGVVEVLGCVVLARPVLEITFGASYGSLSPYAWLWVVQGAALSLVQLLVYRAIAVRDRVTGALIGLAAGVEAAVVLLVRPDQPATIIAIAATVAAAMTVVLFARSSQERPR